MIIRIFALIIMVIAGEVIYSCYKLKNKIKLSEMQLQQARERHITVPYDNLQSYLKEVDKKLLAIDEESK